MKLRTIRAQNFRGFADTTLTLDPALTILVGVNGAGKTSILDAIVIGVGAFFLGTPGISAPGFDPEDARWRFFDYDGQIRREQQFPVSVTCVGEVTDRERKTRPIEWTRSLAHAKGKTDRANTSELRLIAEGLHEGATRGERVDLPILARYTTGRLFWQKKQKAVETIPPESRMAGYIDCLDPAASEKKFLQWFKTRELQSLQHGARLPELEAVRSVITRCLERCERVYFDVGTDELRIVFDDRREISADQLSDGYRALLALVSDLAMRCEQLNPHMGELAPRTTEGIVLIDEVELHLHPAWQRRVLKVLMDAFPCCQFVTTTHSPQVLSDRPGGAVVILKDFQPVAWERPTAGRDSNSLLREVFGVSERPQAQLATIQKIRALIDDDQLDEARTQLDALTDELSEADTEVMNLQMRLHVAEGAE